jgi:hypothetical protein
LAPTKESPEHVGALVEDPLVRLPCRVSVRLTLHRLFSHPAGTWGV